MALCKFSPANEILADCQGFELRGHRSHLRQWFIIPHKYILRNPIKNLWILFRDIHEIRSLTVSFNSFVRLSSGQSIRWAAVSCHPQLGHLLSGYWSPEYRPTWTLVPQNPECCFDRQILNISALFFRARSRWSQSTE